MLTPGMRAICGPSYLRTMGLAIVLCTLLAVGALAAPGGIEAGIASGYPETLQADGRKFCTQCGWKVL